LEHQKLSSLKELEKKSKPSPEKPSSKEQEKNDFEKQKQLRGIQQKIGTLERKITVLEKEIKEIDFDLEVDYEKTISQPNFFDSYQSKKKELEALMEQWEALQQTLD
jgi:ATP-binding cassette subfamily F protein 3